MVAAARPAACIAHTRYARMPFCSAEPPSHGAAADERRGHGTCVDQQTCTLPAHRVSLKVLTLPAPSPAFSRALSPSPFFPLCYFAQSVAGSPSSSAVVYQVPPTEVYGQPQQPPMNWQYAPQQPPPPQGQYYPQQYAPQQPGYPQWQQPPAPYPDQSQGYGAPPPQQPYAPYGEPQQMPDGGKAPYGGAPPPSQAYFMASAAAPPPGPPPTSGWDAAPPS